jgi:gamma-glutamyltranspeptidase/glutathione hydrolase
MNRKLVSVPVLLSIWLQLFAFSVFAEPNLRPAAEPSISKHGMVASQHPLASQIGVDVLKKGGNAVDAAVAVGLALAVVYPEAGNLGGGGFMLMRKANENVPRSITGKWLPLPQNAIFSSTTMANSLRAKAARLSGIVLRGFPEHSPVSNLRSKKHGSGRIKWAELVEPARLLAVDGYTLTHRLAELFKSYKETLSKYPESRRVFLNNGKYFEGGDIFRQPDLAKTLSRVKTAGASDFYRGETARLIAADMKAHGGLITLDDLKNYVAKERTPCEEIIAGTK